MELPPCRHRGAQLVSGNWDCRSPKLIAPKGVNADICCRCPYSDHEFAAPPPDWRECVHLGAPTGELRDCGPG